MSIIIPNTRGEAIRIGAKHYFTGKPCFRNHVGLRYASGHCISCAKINNGLEKYKAAKKAYRQRPEVKAKSRINVKLYMREYRKTAHGQAYQKKFQKVYRNDPANRERLLAIQRKYYIKKFYGGDEERYIETQRKRALNKEKRDGRKGR